MSAIRGLMRRERPLQFTGWFPGKMELHCYCCFQQRRFPLGWAPAVAAQPPPAHTTSLFLECKVFCKLMHCSWNPAIAPTFPVSIYHHWHIFPLQIFPLKYQRRVGRYRELWKSLQKASKKLQIPRLVFLSSPAMGTDDSNIQAHPQQLTPHCNHVYVGSYTYTWCCRTVLTLVLVYGYIQDLKRLLPPFPLVKVTLFAGEKGHVCVVPDHSLLTQVLLSSYKQMFTRFKKREFTHTLVTDSWRRDFNLYNRQLTPHPMFAKKDGLQYKQIRGREFEGRARLKRKCLHNKHNSYNDIRIFSPSVSQAKGLRKAVIWKAHMDICPSCALLSAKGYRRKTACKNLVAKV